MIEIENVSRDFGSVRAVDNVSFSVQKGEIVGLLGPNGAGKTTTMRMITGFLDPSSGLIKIDGQDISTDPKSSKAKIGYMPESAPLYGEMIVDDYLRYVASVQGADAEVKVPQLAGVCGLTEVMHKNIGDLSRGYRQRVGLAHSLINDPEILILDEPTSGLDPNQIIECAQSDKGNREDADRYYFHAYIKRGRDAVRPRRDHFAGKDRGGQPDFRTARALRAQGVPAHSGFGLHYP